MFAIAQHLGVPFSGMLQICRTQNSFCTSRSSCSNEEITIYSSSSSRKRLSKTWQTAAEQICQKIETADVAIAQNGLSLRNRSCKNGSLDQVYIWGGSGKQMSGIHEKETEMMKKTLAKTKQARKQQTDVKQFVKKTARMQNTCTHFGISQSSSLGLSLSLLLLLLSPFAIWCKVEQLFSRGHLMQTIWRRVARRKKYNSFKKWSEIAIWCRHKKRTKNSDVPTSWYWTNVTFLHVRMLLLLDTSNELPLSSMQLIYSLTLCSLL
jgi:hypothetical protein